MFALRLFAAVALAAALRRSGIKAFWPYWFVSGSLSWLATIAGKAMYSPIAAMMIPSTRPSTNGTVWRNWRCSCLDWSMRA